jgi:hypothetical protein
VEIDEGFSSGRSSAVGGDEGDINATKAATPHPSPFGDTFSSRRRLSKFIHSRLQTPIYMACNIS